MIITRLLGRGVLMNRVTTEVGQWRQDHPLFTGIVSMGGNTGHLIFQTIYGTLFTGGINSFSGGKASGPDIFGKLRVPEICVLFGRRKVVGGR